MFYENIPPWVLNGIRTTALIQYRFFQIKHHTKLTAKERDLIAVWKGGNVGIREIARKLGCSLSTICDGMEERRKRALGRN